LCGGLFRFWGLMWDGGMDDRASEGVGGGGEWGGGGGLVEVRVVDRGGLGRGEK